jgi:hypothetical protein
MPANPYNAREVILERINVDDNLDVTVDDVVFENPVKPTEPLPIRNTILRIRSLTSSAFYGVKTFHYNRIHIDEVGPMTVERGAANTWAALLPAINEKYGLFMVPEDIIDGNIPVGLTGEIPVTLAISPNSLTWYDGPVIALAP